MTANHNNQPRKIDLIQAKGKHDILVLEYSQVSPLWFESIKSGLPVVFGWGHGKDEKNWIGYVQGVTKTVNPQRKNLMKVTCWGSSFVLKDRVTRSFKNSTIPEAVKKIVTEHGFRFIGDISTYRFPQLLIAGQSYWEWIQEQANFLGYGAYVDGMDFYFKKLDSLINQSFSSATVLSMNNQTIPIKQTALDRTLQRFSVINSEHVEDSRALRAIKSTGGVDPFTGEVFVEKHSPEDTGSSIRENVSSVFFNQHLPERVSNSRSSAKTISKGAAEIARFNLPANAQCQGNSKLRPYASVYISGTGELTDGYWLVYDAHHTFSVHGDHEVELSLRTDGIGKTRQTPFRKRDASTVGLVDLNYALENKGTIPNSFKLNSVRLKNYSPIVNQGKQGFKRTPTLWQSIRKG
jgi:phage protein D